MEATGKSSQLNKRKYIRHPAEIPIKFKLTGDGLSRTDTTRNISIGGLCFQAPEYIPPGTALTLRFPTVHPEVELRGHVVWCTEVKGVVDVGVEFENENEAYRARTIEEICYSKKFEGYFE